MLDFQILIAFHEKPKKVSKPAGLVLIQISEHPKNNTYLWGLWTIQLCAFMEILRVIRIVAGSVVVVMKSIFCVVAYATHGR